MHHKIKISDDNKYIILEVEDDIINEKMIKCIEKAHQLGMEKDIHFYFVDLRMSKNIDSVTNNYTFAYEKSKEPLDFDNKAKVVMLADPSDHSHDFVETVLRNAGFQVKLFKDYSEAINNIYDRLAI
jgi:hypothetical protein